MIYTKNDLSKEICQKAEPKEVLEIIELLDKELKNSSIPGVGLSAPQVNINKAVAIIRLETKENEKYNLDLINPVLLEGNDLIIFEEGCLSFPGEYCKTIRYSEITVEIDDIYANFANSLNKQRYNNTEINLEEKSDLLNKRKIILTGLPAIVAQHEIAHLYGKVMQEFKPIELGRNDLCYCKSGKKNKKCHNVSYFNSNLNVLFERKFI